MSWPLVKLGDVAPAKASKHTFAETDDVWTLNLDQVEADTGKVLQKIIAPVSAAGPSTHGFDERHVLYSKLRPYLNKVVLPDDKGLATTELVPMLPDAGRLDRKYLAYYLRSKSFVDWVSSQVAGAKMPRVSMQLFWQHEIPLPPLSEQKRIAAILDKADAIRRKRQQAIQLADDFLRAVFLDMFGDPVANPKGWPTAKLGELCGVGSSKRVFVDEFTDSGIPFYRGTEVGMLGEGQEIQAELFISKDHYDDLVSHSGAPEVGDLLLPSICHDGRIWKVNHREPFYFKDGRVLWVKVNRGIIDSDFLRSYLQWIFFLNYSAIASGTTFAELKIVNLKALNILTPPLPLQKNFSELVKTVSGSGKLCSASGMAGENLFSALAQKAFCGQL